MLQRSLFTVFFLIAFLPAVSRAADMWAEQQRGTNCFNQDVPASWFEAVSVLNPDFIRLVPDKWGAAERDFLVGDCDNFTAINETDFARLKSVLDLAHAHKQRIVLSMLSLPGFRYAKQDGDNAQDPLWKDEKYQLQAVAFWRELAMRLKGHPAIVAYDPLNEPHPARADGIEDTTDAKFPEWLAAHKDGPADLDRFYRRIVAAIRESDPAIPVIVEGYAYGSAGGIGFITPLDDPNILYSFHCYDPWQFSTFRVNKGRYAYPSRMANEWGAPGQPWTRDDLSKLLDPVRNWQKKHSIPANRIIAGEFGVSRRVEGAKQYLADLTSLLNEAGYHWAFYAFREDVWKEMDYEFGDSPKYNPGERKSNSLFDVLRTQFTPRK